MVKNICFVLSLVLHLLAWWMLIRLSALDHDVHSQDSAVASERLVDLIQTPSRPASEKRVTAGPKTSKNRTRRPAEKSRASRSKSPHAPDSSPAGDRYFLP